MLKLTHLTTMRAIDLSEHGVHESAARAWRRPEQLDVLRKERNDDELAGRIFRPLGGTVEQVAARPPAFALGGREEERFDAAVVLGTIDLGPDARRGRAPADHLRVVAGAR